jgi:hypothetical protein
MTSYRRQLIDALNFQTGFARGYSPLYEALFRVLGTWLEREASDPLAFWLLNAVRERVPFEVTLLLPASLHRAVLSGDPAASDLARYYPTAGGETPTPTDAELATVLLGTMRDLQPVLEPFLRTATVQTNETARGLVWLWPLAQTGWPAVDLLELGASAGLNLVADRRAYRLVDSQDPQRPPLDLGHGDPVQFLVHATETTIVRGQSAEIPAIISRTGLDLRPFRLPTAAEELTLASFVWGDQPARLNRLREGIAALRAAEAAGDGPRLEAVSLPDQLGEFLAGRMPAERRPLVIYNTAVTMYLEGRQEGLRRVLEPWAAAQPRPVVWLQWEPGSVAEGPAPHDGWYAWTADSWRAGEHRRVQLAWVHPHAAGLEWLPGAAEWLVYPHFLH